MAEAVKRGVRKSRTGIVKSDSMDKTIVVSVTDRYRHPLYGKIVKRTKKFHAHDEKNDARIGDKVTISETRPLSKQKRWRLLEIVNKAPTGEKT